MAERGKHERLAANITDQMYKEAQVFTEILFCIEHVYRDTAVALQSSIEFAQSHTYRLLHSKQFYVITVLVLLTEEN